MTAEQVEEQTADNEAAQSTDTAAQAAATESAGSSEPTPETTQPAASTQADAPGTVATPGTADPAPEAAIGASGARPLGDAEEIADKANAAVERMSEGAAEDTAGAPAEGAGEPAAGGSQAAAGEADGADPAADSSTAETAAAQSPATQSSGDDGAQPETAATAAPAAAAATAPADEPAGEDDAQTATATADSADQEQPTADSADQEQPTADSAGQEQATAQSPPEQAGEAQPGDGAAPPAERPRPTGPEPTTMEELLNEQQTEIKSLKHGDVVEGNVVRIDKDEILVDIGAKSEGVVSNRELYGRNTETQPKLNIGDQVLVYVLQPESPEGHAVLSLRRAGLERKWRAMQEQLDAGAIIEAPVIDHNKGGLIVDCGIRGFVPISQIVDFPRRPQNEQPRDAAQEIAEKLQPYVGRKLRLKILEVNRKANRLILSEKVALYEERREKRDELFSSLQVGQKVTGTVRSIAPFGVFIDLGGIDGLVHKSELSWNKVNNPEAGYKMGDEVEAEVIDINHERGRISLSIRRLQPDPWHSTVADLKVGDVIDGVVTKIVNFGAFVRVRDGLEGLIHISELSHQRVVHPGDVVHEGQKLKLKVISLDSERHRLGLSLKQAEEEPAPRAEREPRERRPRGERGPGYDPSQAVQEPEGGIDNTLAAAFAQVRQQMEQTEAARESAQPGEEQPEAGQPAQEQPAQAPAEQAEPGASTEPTEPAAEAQAQTDADVIQQAPEPPSEQAEAADAPALEVGVAEGGADQPAQTTEKEEPEPAAEQGEAGATSEAPAAEEPEPAAEQPEPEPAAEQGEASATDEAADGGQAVGKARPGAKGKSGKPVAETSGEPAEGPRDAAPDAGADIDESAADKGTDEG